jgi:hypothetical protein
MQLFATTATLVVKTQIKNLSPELLNLNRAMWLLLIFSVIMFYAMGDSVSLFQRGAIKNTVIGAVLEFTLLF